MAQSRFVGKGELFGARFEEEVERIDDRQLGDEIDLDLELTCLFRKDQAGKVIRLGVLLPVDEVLFRRDLQRVAEDRCARVRRRAQADDLWREADRPVIAIVRDVVEGDMDRHDRLRCKGDGISLAKAAPFRVHYCHALSGGESGDTGTVPVRPICRMHQIGLNCGQAISGPWPAPRGRRLVRPPG